MELVELQVYSYPLIQHATSVLQRIKRWITSHVRIFPCGFPLIRANMTWRNTIFALFIFVLWKVAFYQPWLFCILHALVFYIPLVGSCSWTYGYWKLNVPHSYILEKLARLKNMLSKASVLSCYVSWLYANWLTIHKGNTENMKPLHIDAYCNCQASKQDVKQHQNVLTTMKSCKRLATQPLPRNETTKDSCRPNRMDMKKQACFQ